MLCKNEGLSAAIGKQRNSVSALESLVEESAAERRTPNAERRTPNAERRTVNAERRTLNAERERER